MRNINPFLSLDKLIVGDVYTSREAMDNLTILCDEFGSRFGGTPGEKQAAGFMKAKFEAYGLSHVHLEPIDYIGWRRGITKLELLSPIQKVIPCISLPHSPPADLTGGIVDMGDGAPDDFESRADEIAGKIVLTSSEIRPGKVKRWVHRNEKYGRSLLAGAAGFIFVNHYPGYGPATGGIAPDEGGEGLIPAISVSYEDGAYLRRLIQRHDEVTIHITSNDQCEPMTSWNVIADLPGQSDPDQQVILGCHYDGHDISQGAADPASGTVAVMEAARVLAQYAKALPCTIRFVLWGVEEIGLIGSLQHVETHKDKLKDIRFYLNMDSAGTIPEKGIVLNQWPELETLFRDWSQEMALDFGIKQSVNAHSDHYPFLKAGVPTGGIGSVGKQKSGGRGYGHTKYDTVDKVSLTGLREASVLAARLALRIASLQDWPVSRRSQEAVTAVLDDPDNREESELFDRVNAFYRAARQTNGRLHGATKDS